MPASRSEPSSAVGGQAEPVPGEQGGVGLLGWTQQAELEVAAKILKKGNDLKILALIKH